MSARRRLRISGGSERGRRLEAPAEIRPTSARLREALFDGWSARLPGCRFLDLFAGSGAVGFEAASRGAGRVLLVEGDRRVLGCLERNLDSVGLAAVRVAHGRLPAELARCLAAEERFDLVFADPPYGFAELGALLAAVEPHLSPAGEIALEHRWRDGAAEAAGPLERVRSRRYGDSGLTLYRRT